MTAASAAKPRVHLDLPKPAVIAHPIEHLWGWMAVSDRAQPVLARVRMHLEVVRPGNPAERLDLRRAALCRPHHQLRYFRPYAISVGRDVGNATLRHHRIVIGR